MIKRSGARCCDSSMIARCNPCPCPKIMTWRTTSLQPALAFSGAHHLAGLVRSPVRRALHEQAQRVRVCLGVAAEYHQPVQRRPRDTVQLVDDAAVPQIVLPSRLGSFVRIEALRAHERPHGAEIDVVDGCRRDDLLFRQHESEGVQQLLQFRGRRRPRAPPAPDPEPAVAGERLVSALMPVHVDPVHPPALGLVPAALRGHGLAATGLQKARQPLLNGFRVLHVADDGAAIIDTDDDKPPIPFANAQTVLPTPRRSPSLRLNSVRASSPPAMRRCTSGHSMVIGVLIPQDPRDSPIMPVRHVFTHRASPARQLPGPENSAAGVYVRVRRVKDGHRRVSPVQRLSCTLSSCATLGGRVRRVDRQSQLVAEQFVHRLLA